MTPGPRTKNAPNVTPSTVVTVSGSSAMPTAAVVVQSTMSGVHEKNRNRPAPRQSNIVWPTCYTFIVARVAEACPEGAAAF